MSNIYLEIQFPYFSRNEINSIHSLVKNKLLSTQKYKIKCMCIQYNNTNHNVFKVQIKTFKKT